MILPAIGINITQSGGNATLGGNGMTAGWKNFGYASGFQSRRRHSHGRTQPSATSTNNNNIVIMIR